MRQKTFDELDQFGAALEVSYYERERKERFEVPSYLLLVIY